MTSGPGIASDPLPARPVHTATVDAGDEPAVCPSCGTSDQVRTVQQLFDLLHGVQAEAQQRADQASQAPRPPRRTEPVGIDLQFQDQAEPSQQMANSVLETAGHFLGKAIGKRVHQTYQDRILPALDEQAEHSRQEQATIVERHPDLRGCMRDQVLFVAGGTRVVPMADAMPITLAHTDALVEQLRAP
jgi:hypothetical protein